MANYFHEMGWTELPEGASPNYINIAQILSQLGIWMDPMLQERLKLAPPASKDVVATLPEIKITEKDQQCPVCLKTFVDTDIAVQMPCKHCFHKHCIMPWLEKTNSCPLCRYELATDNEEYELWRKEKERKKVREQELELLHNTMYS